MTAADFYRKDILKELLVEGRTRNNRVKVKSTDGGVFYSEILPLNEIVESTDNFREYGSLKKFLEVFAVDRLGDIISEYDFKIDYKKLDVETTDFYDGYEITVPLLKEYKNPVAKLFDEIDREIGVSEPNKASGVPITKEPYSHKTPNLPTKSKTKKTQNPRRVDLVLKSTFQSKFVKHRIKTDVGEWEAVRDSDANGKLLIVWENKEFQNILIETLIFPDDTNKIVVEVKERNGKILSNTFFEIYRIPTHEVMAEKFYRKTLFSLFKKYVDTIVIRFEPFSKKFVFWKTDNPYFPYSFSTPNKNKIVLDLISFISTAQKPILDDFFEANNLKHKQGYLQTLLDSAEAAGIFKFKREGNEILIVRGPNYKHFLEGKLRRVS